MCTSWFLAGSTRTSTLQLMCADGFHAQAIDFIENEHGHYFAMFSEPHENRGVERATHTFIHTLIHRLCG